MNGSSPITLSYDSRSTTAQSYMGNATSPGWTYGFAGVGSLAYQSNGTTVDFTAADGSVWAFTKASGSSTYTAPPGLKATLTKLTSTWKLYYLESSRTITFDDTGRPLSVADRNNNSFSIDWSTFTITGAAGSTDARTVYTYYDSPQCEMHFFQKKNGTAARDYTVKRNGDGRIQGWRNPDDKWTYAGYNSDGLVSSFYNQTSRQRLDFSYDSQRRVTSVSQVDVGPSATTPTAVTRFSYPSSSQTLVAGPRTDQSQSVSSAPHITYSVDSNGLVTQAVDQQGRTRSKTYNGNLDTATSTTGSGSTASTTTNTYGANTGLSLTKSAAQGGAASQAAYANTAQATQYLPSSRTDSAGNQSTFTYNGAGNQLSSQTAAVAATATLTYNTDGTVATATSPGNAASNKATSYAYDSNHQLTSITPVSGTSLGVKNYTYDSYGRLKTATDGAGRTTTYTYDNEDRLLTTSFSDSTTTVTNTYDEVGNLTKQVSGGGTITNAYDAFNRLTSTSNTAGGGTISYGYDKAGNQVSLTDGRGTTTQTYDSSNVLTATTYPKGSGTASTVFVTNSNGQRTDTYLASNAAHTTWAAWSHTDYDSSGRPSRIIAKNGPSSSPSTVLDMTYCYNTGGSGTNCGSTAGNDRGKLQWTYNSLTSQTTSFTYDGSARLTKVAEANGTNGNRVYDYAYNANGDRTSASVAGYSQSSQTLTYNAADQITNAGYSYDGAGNLTAKPGWTMTYNAAQQMTSATNSSGTVYNYSYAGASQNALLSMSGGGITYKLAYGQPDAVGNPSLLQYQIGSSGTAYIEQDPTTAQATMLHKTDGTQILYEYDGLGSLLGLLSDSGSTEAKFKYDPYGLGFVEATDGGNGVGQNPFAFKSGVQDRATGFVKFGQRWYDAVTGTWTQQDTLDAPLDPTNANRYAYAGNDPINNLDLTGQVSKATGCAIYTAAAAGGGAVAAGAAAYTVITAPGNAVPVAGQANTVGAAAVAAVAGVVAAIGGIGLALNGC